MPDVAQKENLAPVENVVTTPVVEAKSQPAAMEFSKEFQDQVAAQEAGRLAEVSDGIGKFSQEQSAINQEKNQPVVVDESTLSPDKDYATQPIVTTDLTEKEWHEKKKAQPVHGVRWLIENTGKMVKKLGAKLVFKQAA